MTYLDRPGFTFYVLHFTPQFVAHDSASVEIPNHSGAIDTVIVALADPFGRLVGNGFAPIHFWTGCEARDARCKLFADR